MLTQCNVRCGGILSTHTDLFEVLKLSSNRRETKPKMINSIERVCRFLKKTLTSIKSTPLTSPFSYSRGPRGQSKPDSKIKETSTALSCCDIAVVETIHESIKKHHRKRVKKVMETLDEAKRRGEALAKKMKDLNMVDLRDVNHTLDVREALRCYSNIKSPIYLDIVDNFFTDMYYEFSDPRTYATTSINDSRR